MSIASVKAVPEDMRTSIIRVYDYQDKNLQGTFFNPYYGVEIEFPNLTRLLLLMEEMMDKMGYPQASMLSRRFDKKRRAYAEPSVKVATVQETQKRDAIATFQVKVIFRQNASWQGKINWLNENKEQTFRSVFELIKLMDEALPQQETGKELSADYNRAVQTQA